VPTDRCAISDPPALVKFPREGSASTQCKTPARPASPPAGSQAPAPIRNRCWPAPQRSGSRTSMRTTRRTTEQRSTYPGEADRPSPLGPPADRDHPASQDPLQPAAGPREPTPSPREARPVRASPRPVRASPPPLLPRSADGASCTPVVVSSYPHTSPPSYRSSVVMACCPPLCRSSAQTASAFNRPKLGCCSAR
jgi:hypothetical protein